MSGLAFDRSITSARSYDLDGRLRVDAAVISQANVSPYFGDEIPDNDKLGLDPQRIYRVWRPPDGLLKAAPSARGLPILTSHQPVDALELRPDLLVGATLSDARFQAPHLVCSIALWSAEAIKNVESGAKSALSAGYRWVPGMEPGIYNGKPYDGSMRDIVFNHVALVDVGRIGPDAVIADRAPDWRIEERIFADFRRRIVNRAA